VGAAAAEKATVAQVQRVTSARETLKTLDADVAEKEKVVATARTARDAALPKDIGQLQFDMEERAAEVEHVPTPVPTEIPPTPGTIAAESPGQMVQQMRTTLQFQDELTAKTEARAREQAAAVAGQGG